MKKILLVFFVCIMANLPIFSLAQEANIWKVVNTATTSSGLPSDEVISLLFSSDGKLWVSTNLALATFDGQKWKKYEEQDSFPLSNKRLGKLFEDSKSNIWVCSDENGLTKLNQRG